MISIKWKKQTGRCIFKVKQCSIFMQLYCNWIRAKKIMLWLCECIWLILNEWSSNWLRSWRCDCYNWATWICGKSKLYWIPNSISRCEIAISSVHFTKCVKERKIHSKRKKKLKKKNWKNIERQRIYKWIFQTALVCVYAHERTNFIGQKQCMEWLRRSRANKVYQEKKKHSAHTHTGGKKTARNILRNKWIAYNSNVSSSCFLFGRLAYLSSYRSTWYFG